MIMKQTSKKIYNIQSIKNGKSEHI